MNPRVIYCVLSMEFNFLAYRAEVFDPKDKLAAFSVIENCIPHDRCYFGCYAWRRSLALDIEKPEAEYCCSDVSPAIPEA